MRNLFICGLVFIITKNALAQKAVDVVLTPYKTTMLANGSDQSEIHIKIFDGNGKVMPDANQTVHLSLRGPGRIVRMSTDKNSMANLPTSDTSGDCTL